VNLNKNSNNRLHRDCHKRHVFCKRAAKATPLMAAREAGVRVQPIFMETLE